MVPFLAMHVACLAVFFTGVHAFDVVLCVFLYGIRMFGITAGYHRYFAHRAYKTSRPMQFVLGWLGCMSMQKGPLWWAANHRDHHLYSDTDKDPHSPITKSFWWSHLGWVLSDQFDETDWETIRDFKRFSELRWLNTWHWVPGIIAAVLSWLAGGFSPIVLAWLGAEIEPAFSFARAWSALVVGFLLSTVTLYHGTFAVNSICHVLGRRRYATNDYSRNNWLVALITGGEGWHNNHHYYQSSANQGFFWWEVDTSYYMIRALSLCGLVWDVRTPPANKLVPTSGAAPLADVTAAIAATAGDIAAKAREIAAKAGGDIAAKAADIATKAGDIAARAGGDIAAKAADIAAKAADIADKARDIATKAGGDIAAKAADIADKARDIAAKAGDIVNLPQPKPITAALLN